MAPSQPNAASTTGRVELRSLSQRSSMIPFYSSTTLSSSTSDLNNINNAEPLSPRILYAQSFDRPQSSRSLPSNRFRKNMKEMTGFGTTEEEFEALPIAVRRKVRQDSSASIHTRGRSRASFWLLRCIRSASWKARPQYRVIENISMHLRVHHQDWLVTEKSISNIMTGCGAGILLELRV
jgi:hypothetical protein